jgi:hypothetical protein
MKEKGKRAAYTLEYKLKAGRLVQGRAGLFGDGQSAGHSQADAEQRRRQAAKGKLK